MTVHEQLLAIGTPIVQHYVRDLTEHDKVACDNIDAGGVAFWSPRECGTEFIHLSGDERSIRWNLGYLNAAEKTWPNRTWYKIAEGKVRSTTIEHARRCFYRDLAKFEPVRAMSQTAIWA